MNSIVKVVDSSNFYVHYRANNYLSRSKYLDKIKVAKMKNDMPEAIKARNESAQQAILMARDYLRRNSKKVTLGQDKVAKQLSKIYTNFVFGPEKKVKSSLYNEQIISQFQEIFNNSKFIEKFKLFQFGEGINLLNYDPTKITDREIKNYIYENDSRFGGASSTEEIRLQELRKNIDLYCKMAGRALGQNGFDQNSGQELLDKFDKLAEEIRKAKETAGSKKKGDKFDPNVKYYKITDAQKDSLTEIIYIYNTLIQQIKAFSINDDQGYYGEAVIAGINAVLSAGSILGAQQVLQQLEKDMNEELVQRKRTDGKLGRHRLSDKVEVSLGMVGSKKNTYIKNRAYSSSNIFNTDILEEYFGKAFSMVDAKRKGNGKRIEIDLHTSTSTADIIFSWEGQENLGMSIKNYRKGFKTAREGVQIINGINLLSILQMLPSAFDHHFANMTSILYTSKNKKASRYRKLINEAKQTIALALVTRGLVGFRGINREKGEADYFTMIDSSSRQVQVFSTKSLLNKLFTLKKFTQAEGFDMQGFPKDNNIYNNEWKGKVNDWKDAKIRNSLYLVSANKISLSLHIKKRGWEQLGTI